MSIKYLFLPAILLMIFLVNCTSNPSPADVDELIKKGIQKDMINYEYALNKTDISYCEKISGEIRKTSCYTQLANHTRNSSICQFLKSPRKENCHILLALETDNISACSSIDSFNSTYGSQLCNQAFAIKRRDVSICENLAGDYRFVCITNVAAVEQNISLCERIIIPQFKDSCRLEVEIHISDLNKTVLNKS